MENRSHTYVAIDLKSFYASVECVERGLDPLTTNLVVADESRTDKTICLAVSPTLKKYGIPGRPRLFEVARRVRQINSSNPELHLQYLVAPPRMALYLDYSTRIYQIYLKYIAPEDMHVYSIDEVFLDVTAYLDTYRMTARELASRIIRDILRETGITATAGIGTNLYLCKVAMDIVAKHTAEDEDGVRIAELDEMSYRQLLWDHRPITDFWRVGSGYAQKLKTYGLETMGDVARCSVAPPDCYCNEELLYKLFGKNAELLIDHAWGWEPVTMADIKAYRPQVNSLSCGQVLQEPYPFEKGRIIVREMAEMMALDLLEKKLVTDQIVLTIGYDRQNLSSEKARKSYRGEITVDHYGRKVPKHAHGTENLDCSTSSARLITEAALSLYDRLVNPVLSIRRVTLAAGRVVSEQMAATEQGDAYEQMNLFTDYGAREQQRQQERLQLEKERKMHEAILSVKKKYGKNAILKGTDLQEGATTRQRNEQIGGHKA